MMCLSGLRQLKLFFTILRLMPSDPALYFFAIEKKIMQISVLPLLDLFLVKVMEEVIYDSNTTSEFGISDAGSAHLLIKNFFSYDFLVKNKY